MPDRGKLLPLKFAIERNKYTTDFLIYKFMFDVLRGKKPIVVEFDPAKMEAMFVKYANLEQRLKDEMKVVYKKGFKNGMIAGIGIACVAFGIAIAVNDAKQR